MENLSSLPLNTAHLLKKADYWIPIKCNTDTALFLGLTKILMDEKLYDADYVKKFTDFPLLVRTDTLKRPQAKDIIPDYKLEDISHAAKL